jgi:hypothetical protein
MASAAIYPDKPSTSSALVNFGEYNPHHEPFPFA